MQTLSYNFSSKTAKPYNSQKITKDKIANSLMTYNYPSRKSIQDTRDVMVKKTQYNSIFLITIYLFCLLTTRCGIWINNHFDTAISMVDCLIWFDFSLWLLLLVFDLLLILTLLICLFGWLSLYWFFCLFDCSSLYWFFFWLFLSLLILQHDCFSLYIGSYVWLILSLLISSI